MLWMLSACNHIPVKNVPVGPPTVLYSTQGETWPTAPPRGSTNADIVSYVHALKDRLGAAYADREAIRVWAKGALGK